jgi:hypothetical protein
MKLPQSKLPIVVNNDLCDKSFSIGDESFIFDILRSKMYSDPIGSICREVSCNARDAMREAGRAEIPIKITLPTTLEPYFKVEDTGIGISPDRIENIFIKYGISSKRDTNELSGAFGLGSKVPFSYSDSFNIITIFDKIKYNYSCYIDETKVGKLALLFQEPTTERNGTEIQIPVKKEDFYLFIDSTRKACEYWDVKPIIKGTTINWTDRVILLKGDTWAIESELSYNRKVKVIVDGIEYPLDIYHIDPTSKFKINLPRYIKGNAILYFKNGEVSLSASREQLYFDDQTKQIIIHRLQTMSEEINKTIQDQISACPTFWQANALLLNTIRKNIIENTNDTIWKKFVWNDARMAPDSGFGVGANTLYYFKRNNTKHSKYGGNHKSTITFEENTDIYLNDCDIDRPTYRHIKKAFENTELDGLYVVQLHKDYKIEDLNQAFHFDLMGHKKLSSIFTKNPKPAPKKDRLVVFYFDRWKFTQASLKSIKEDKNKKILCQLTLDSDNPSIKLIKVNDRLINVSHLSLFNKLGDISFYGILDTVSKDKIKNTFSDCESLKTFFDRDVFGEGRDFVKNQFFKGLFPNNRLMYIRNYFSTLKIADPESLYLKYLECDELIFNSKGQNGSGHEMIRLYECVYGEITDETLAQYAKDHPEYNLSGYVAKCKIKYPMLSYVSDQSMHGAVLKDMITYINQMDSLEQK